MNTISAFLTVFFIAMLLAYSGSRYNLMANTYVDTKINGIDVCCDVHAEPYIATDSWSPNEDGEIDLECVTVKREGQAFIDGKWIDAIVRIDLLPLLSDDAIDLLIEKCHDDLINDKG